ncbi:HAD family hydrolase [Nocardia takedensis]
MNPSARTATAAKPRCDCVPTVPTGVAAVIFDFDGTLADTTDGHERALRAALRPHGIDLDHRWYRDHVGLSIHELLTALPGAARLSHDRIIAHSRTRLLADLHTITPNRCVVELLRTARRSGLPCAVASGAGAALVVPGIDVLGLTGEFAATVTRDDVAHGKPAPDLFAEAARRLGIAPGACLAVEDSADGLASARAAGMSAITVIDGHLIHSDTYQGAGAPTSPHDHTMSSDQGA